MTMLPGRRPPPPAAYIAPQSEPVYGSDPYVYQSPGTPMPEVPELPDPWQPATPRPRRELSGTVKAAVVLVGALASVLTAISGLGILSQDVRDIVAIVLAGLTAVLVWAADRRPKSD